MQVNIKQVDLPTATGCEHLNVTLEFPDGKTELRGYHLTDFTAEQPTQSPDPVYLRLLMEAKASRKTDRAGLKQVFEKLKIQM